MVRVSQSLATALLIAAATTVPFAAGQTSQLQREICAASVDLGAKVQACSEMLDFGNLDAASKARTYAFRANAYRELGKFDLALGDYGRALDLVPFDAILFHSRGLALNRLGRSADALKDLDRALMLRPDYGNAYETRAITLLDHALSSPPENRRGHLAHALADVDQAIRLQGPDAEGRLRIGRGRINFYIGSSDAAIADFTRALALEPDSLEALSLRGAAYADMGNMALAIADFSRFLVLEPRTSVVRTARAFGYFQQQQYRLALADLERVLADAPDNLPAIFCRGVARVRTGDPSGQSDIDAVTQRRPDIAEAQAMVCPVSD